MWNMHVRACNGKLIYAMYKICMSVLTVLLLYFHGRDILVEVVTVLIIIIIIKGGVGVKGLVLSVTPQPWSRMSIKKRNMN